MTRGMKKRSDAMQGMDVRCVFGREIQMLEKLVTLFRSLGCIQTNIVFLATVRVF